MSELAKRDPEIAAVIRKEEERQQHKLVLIASENYASQAVLEAQGSVLTNKYAEGYPGRRYYGSCEWVDEAERIAIARVKQLFQAEYANVQPHSGSQANAAVYLALLKPGDTVLAMSLAHGGHLTHGSPASFSGKLYRFVHYGVNRETELLDYEELERLAREHRPKLIVAGASSYPRSIDFERIRHVADEVGAKVMVDIAHPAGLIAVGIHPTPVPWAEVVTSTTQKTLRGPRGGFILARQELAKALDSAVFPGTQGGPLMHVIAAKAVCFHEALQPEFAVYQKSLAENAKVLAAELARLGFRIVTGGTDNHLLLVDLRPAGITGRVAEEALDAIGISANRNAIPFDPLPPNQASGLRLGTAATTTRGLGTKEMKQIAAIIHRLLTGLGDEKLKGRLAEEVRDICDRFPIPHG
ncbi:MAG: serine hydroxymethyltransferase [Dehalococcoidia bacterium]|nr:serine hydroxymethyltransferase [Dehalococcoidia bacterium]